MENVGALKDRKDFKTDTPRRNELVRHSMWINKMHSNGVRIISWIFPVWLNFKHTPMYMARTTETQLVELWGKPLKQKQETIIYQKQGQLNLPQDTRITKLRDAPFSKTIANKDEEWKNYANIKRTSVKIICVVYVTVNCTG